jgi:adenylate cyclase
MEPLFLAVICGCNAGLYRDALHEVYIPRIQRGNASFAAKILGARGPLLSALVHFFEDGRWGRFVRSGVEGQSLTAEDQLFILTQATLYLTAARGLASPEAQLCCERAEPLCRALDRPLLLYSALKGQWRYSLMTCKLSATLQIAKRVVSLAQEQHDAALMIGAYSDLAATFYFLGDFETARRHATRGIEIWRSGTAQSQVEEAYAPAVTCLIYLALTGWQFGETAPCQETMEEAIALAKELNDMYALVHALYWAAHFAYFADNPAEVERLASDLMERSTRQNFATWLPHARSLRGWVRSASGDLTLGISWIEEGIENYRAAGAILALPFLLSLKARALHLAGRASEALELIEEAKAVVERSEARMWCAELHRLRGVFLAAIGANEAQIEASFCAAIRTAKEQKSISLAKRAEESYAGYQKGES